MQIMSKKQQLFLYPRAVTIFFRTIWWDLIIENFCLEPYVEVATRMRYYTNIIKKKEKKLFEVQTYRPGYFVTSISIN